MRTLISGFIAAGLLALPALAIAKSKKNPTQPQALNLTERNQARLDTNKAGMRVLLGWSLLNMGTGAVGWAITDDARWRAFHQMNIGWNIVNAAIAGFSLYSGRQKDASAFDLGQTLKENNGIELALLFNAGLDMAYIATGAYLWEKGRHDAREQFVGFGQSLILQGAFLFAFDLTLFFFHRNHSKDLLMQLSPTPGGLQMGVSAQF